VAGLVVSETRHLDPERRRGVDAQLAGELDGCAPRQAAALARKLAYAADPEGFVARGRTARADRRVGLRPAPDTMSVLSGFLPVEQGVACWAALRAYTDTVKGAGDSRTRDQIMADTLVERITGQARAGDVQAEVAIVTSGAVAGHGAVAEVLGYGPIPVPLAREILAESRGRRWWRRLFTAPHGGVVGGDPTRRCFDGTLATLIGYRDGGRCREPFCAAPRPAHRPHRRAPNRRPDHVQQRSRHLRAFQPGPGDARLAGPARARRVGRAAAHRRHRHPDRAHLHQPRRARSLTSALGPHPLGDQTGVRG
jgi:hypothetical protein